uniref:Serine phosphatase RsbU n=1 Tax=uncultured bacterium esnapd14 TaxID=1366594 RepID=S5TL83_9BACT|nr:serine phosphatase RsbU [uncultured bacterium esnapd14]
MFYQGLDEFLDGATTFLREGIAAGEPALVVVGSEKIDALRAELGQDAAQVQFADMAAVGENPARIIPAWQRFTSQNLRPGQTVRGIGEPIYPERSPAELIECQGHETLLNVAFDDGPPWRLLCPYDTAALPPDVINEAKRSHPYLTHHGRYTTSDIYVAQHPSPARWDQPLPPAPRGTPAHTVGKDGHTLAELRGVIRRHASQAGLDDLTTGRLLTAACEVATNALTHGGGTAVLQLWQDNSTLLCDVHNDGYLDATPLLGRQQPTAGQPSGRGMWLTHQLCDLVQIRTGPSGTTIRLHIKIDN